MGELQKKIDAIMRLVTADTTEKRNAALEEVRMLLNSTATPAADPETIIRNILLELGAPDNLFGHPVIVEAVMIVLEDNRYIKNRVCDLYGELAVCFDTTAVCVERSIRHLIERTWTLGDVKKQDEYFGATIDFNRGKPTNGQFIARLANITRQRLKVV